MNKQFFAKYLPVEGEIQEGDKAIDSNIYHPNNIVTITFDKYHIASDGRGTYSSEGFKKLKKVKLFLCSGDNPNYQQEILTKDIREGQEFSEKEKNFLTLGSVVGK